MTSKEKSIKEENDFVNHLLEVGIKIKCRCWERGNYYYQFQLNNGEIRYWTNISDENLKKIGW